MENFGISEKSYELIIETLKKYPEIERAIIFGSRAKGNFKPGSDIDLAIIGNKCTIDLALKLNGILNESLPIPYFVDVVDYNSITNDQLREHINRVGLIFYTKEP